MIALILLLTVFLVSLLSWLLLLKDARQLKIKGPLPMPIIGNAHMLAVNAQKFILLLGQLTREYGNVYRLYLFSDRYLFMSDPKYIECILSSSELITKGRSYEYLKPWLGYGLLTAGGQRWRTHRKFLTPTLHFNILQNFLPVFCKNEKILNDKLKTLADGKSFDLFSIIALAALDNVTESIMAVPMNVQSNTESKYVKAINSISAIVSTRMRNSFLASDPLFRLTPLKKQQNQALSIIHGQSKKVIDARREELKKTNINSVKDSADIGIKNKHAFLDLLLLAEIDGQKMKDEHVREEVDTFMFEGHDTVTSGIVFSLYCISKHKDVQDKIFAEQQSIFGDDLHRDPIYSELQQMKYLEMVIKESLRLFPSVPLFERSITQDTDLAGLRIPADTSVIIDVFNMQRHPDLYEDPLRFDPERFDSSVHRNPFSWLPFSAGPRNCIGQRFAMMELKITLAGIVKTFEILPSDIEPVLAPDIVLRSSTGVHVKLIPRN